MKKNVTVTSPLVNARDGNTATWTWTLPLGVFNLNGDGMYSYPLNGDMCDSWGGFMEEIALHRLGTWLTIRKP